MLCSQMPYSGSVGMIQWAMLLHKMRLSPLASLHAAASHLKALTVPEPSSMASDNELGSMNDCDGPHQSDKSSQRIKGAGSFWKVLKQGDHPLDDNLIPLSAWKVLRGLQEQGYETYLVGGSVRDMLIKQVPKDFDVLTTAEPSQIRKRFKRSMIIGRRFPICHVNISGNIVEVSSFSTSLRNIKEKCNASWNTFKPEQMKESLNQQDFARCENCLKRDFTINGLMYDPFKGILYDYVGGVEDLRRMKVRTVIPADKSFTEDIARLLRAIRIAARLRFTFSRDIAKAIRSHAKSITLLEKGRLIMEINFMLAYGAAEASMRLLWRFGVLEIVLPFQAAYFASIGFKRQEAGSNILLKLMENLDKNVAPDRPCHSTLWLCLLAMHLALVDHPRSQVIICAFVIAIYTKRGVTKAVQKAKKIQSRFRCSELLFPEIDQRGCPCDMEIEYEVLMLRDDVIDALHTMHDENAVRRAMQRYPEAPKCNQVVVSRKTLEKSEALFERIQEVQHNRIKSRKPSTPINYGALLEGDADEISFLFSRILMNTLYPVARKKSRSKSKPKLQKCSNSQT